MDLGHRVETFGNDNQSWQGSAHGTHEGETVTLDRALLDAAWIAQGFIPSGVFLGRVTATGLYGPYDDAAGDGRNVARGVLLTAVKIGPNNPIGSMIWHGQVLVSRLPAGNRLDAAARADLPQIRFED